jgi:hypothetical protein
MTFTKLWSPTFFMVLAISKSHWSYGDSLDVKTEWHVSEHARRGAASGFCAGWVMG